MIAGNRRIPSAPSGRQGFSGFLLYTHNHELLCERRDVWTSAYVNDLPDSAFAYIEPGGTKEDGKTTPRSLRHFPHHDAAGKLDLPHLRNALSRAPQSEFGAKAMPHLRAHAKAAGVGQDSADSDGVERRTFELEELRVDTSNEDAGPSITGYAAVFDKPSLPIMGMFRETIAPGAFDKVLKGTPDVRALFNHSPDYVLGRTKAKTLSINQDERGLAVDIQPPDTTWARDLITSMQRGDISQMSFAFTVGKDEWSQDGKQRTIREFASLLDVSVVTYPAYPQTSAQARSLILADAGLDMDLLEHLAERRRAGLWTPDESEELRRLIETLQAWIPAESSEEPPPEPDESWRVKAAHRRRSLELLRLRRTG